MQSRKHKKAMVLNELRRNCRRHLTQVGLDLGLPATTVFELERNLHEDIIIRYVSIPRFPPLGFPLHVAYNIQCRPQLIDALVTSPHANTLFLTHDELVLCEAVFSSINQQIEFEELVISVGGAIKETAYVLEILKTEGALLSGKSPKFVRKS